MSRKLTSWSVVFPAWLSELGANATDDQIIEGIKTRFSVGSEDEAYMRFMSKEWREHWTNSYMLHGQGLLVRNS